MRLSLNKKYALTIVGLIIVVVGLLAYASFYHSKKMGAALSESSSRVLQDETLTQIHKFAQSYAYILSERLVNPLYYFDMDTIKKILVESKFQKDVDYVYVYDNTCRIIHDATDEIPKYGEMIPHPELCHDAAGFEKTAAIETKRQIAVARSIWIGDKYLGGIAIGFSLTDVHTNTETMHKALSLVIRQAVGDYATVIGLITLVLIFFGILLSLIISRQFVKPIKEMRGYLRRVGDGDYDVTFQRKPRDEIGELFSSFEEMTHELKASTVSVTELKREIQQRTRAEAERNQMASQLQRSQKMEAVGRLAAGVAHDLNNMLSGIVSYPELLLLDLPETSKMRKPMETVHKSGLKASAIVQDLLTLSRRSVSSAETVDFTQVVKDYLETPEHQKMLSFHPGVKVETTFDVKFTNVNGSAAQLGKIVMNLVNNAAEAMPQGGLIQLEMLNRYIDKPIPGYDKIEQGDYLRFSVIDSGIGIEKGDLEHIFEPFYTKKVMGRSGTGLGMAVVWGAVKDHHGYIDISTSVGKGTRIDLYFPISRKPIKKQTPPKEIDELKGSGETILVVDDVAEQREIASSILARLGYRAVTASSGEEAITYLQSHSVDLVLLDMIMEPGIDGCE